MVRLLRSNERKGYEEEVCCAAAPPADRGERGGL